MFTHRSIFYDDCEHKMPVDQRGSAPPCCPPFPNPQLWYLDCFCISSFFPVIFPPFVSFCPQFQSYYFFVACVCTVVRSHSPYRGLRLDNLGTSLDCNVRMLKERNAPLDDVRAWLLLVQNFGLEAAQELQGRLVQFHQGDFSPETDSWAYVPGQRKIQYSQMHTLG